MEKSRWIYKGKHNAEYIDLLFKKTGVDKNIIQILLNRGVDTEEKIKLFLKPELSNISDPFLFADMEKAVNRIIKSAEAKKKIVVYGDYDVDGVTSVSLFVSGMKKLGYNVEYYIPLREEGYGLNKTAIKKLSDEGCDLMITVDCGISSVEEIKVANELKLDVIITDHHEITGFMPTAFAVINPKREENQYKFRYLAGVGTMFMVLYALFKKLKKDENELFSLMDIVAVGTIADIVPLVEENRIFAKYGLSLLNKSSNLGLRTLIEVLFEDYQTRKFNTYDIGFRIAPVFNAAGRLEDAKKGVELFMAETYMEAKEIANYLKETNVERQIIEKEISGTVEEYIREKNLSEKFVIIAANESFHHGVIGIVASKTVEKYYKPAIILENKADGNSVASARSIEGFNLIKALTSMKELFVKFGGHEGAAGFTIKTTDLEEFEERINKYAEENLKDEDYLKPVKIESEIPIYKASLEFYNHLSQLAPFGFGNPNPMFSLLNVSITNQRLIGKNQDHLMFDMTKDKLTIKNSVWFGKGHNLKKMNPKTKYDVAFTLDLNFYYEKYSAKLYVDDIKYSKAEEESSYSYFSNIYDTAFPMHTIFYSKLHDFTKENEIDIDFDGNYNELTVKRGRTTAGFLSSEVSYVLKELNKYYGTEFDIATTGITKYEQHYAVYATINKSIGLNTYATTPAQLFKEIKDYLIDGFEYNDMQKNVLKNLVHVGKNTVLFSEKGRGIRTIILTIGIYLYNAKEKKTAIIVNENEAELFAENVYSLYFDIYSKVPENISDYDFVIFYNNEGFNKNENFNGMQFVFIDKENKMKIAEEKWVVVKDSFKIPENIKIVEEAELIEIAKNGEIVYSEKLPFHLKKEVNTKIKNGEKVFAVKGVKALV